MPEASSSDYLTQVTEHFEAEAAWWSELYEDDSAAGAVFRRRHGTVLEWVDGLALAPGTRVLEVGCGSGVLAVELARRGLAVDAVDLSPTLVEATRLRAEGAGVSDRVVVQVGDVARLDLSAGAYPLVVAVAIVPWVSSADAAVAALARVLAPGGHAIVTAVNRARLDNLFDPRRNPYLIPARRRLARALSRSGLRPERTFLMRYHSRAEFDALLRTAGLEPVQRTTVGFWGFSMLGRPVPDHVARRLHRRLQRLADRGTPLVRNGGANYMVLARSSGPLAARSCYQIPSQTA